MAKSLKSVLLLTIVALIAVLVIPAAAQDGGRTASPALIAERGAGPAVVNPVPHAITSDLLYDQTANPTTNGIVQNESTVPADGFFIQLADDFEVPAGYEWEIDAYIGLGFWWFDDPTTVDHVTVEFWSDDGGPDVIVCEAEIGTYTLTLTELTVEFAETCVLPEGTYWVSGYPSFDSLADYYRWFNLLVTTSAGSEAYLWDHFDWAGLGCDSWSTFSFCGISAPNNLGFAIYGTEVSAEPEPEPEPEVPAVNYPNHGEIMISANTPVYTYGAAGNYMTGLVLPADYDGNGYDTYIVTDTADVAGEMWYAIWVGGEDYVWVPASQVTVLR